MQATEERPTIPPVRARRRTGLIASLTVLVLAVAAVVAWLVVRGGGEQTATDVVQDYAAAIRADDMASVAGFDPSTVEGGFIEWQIAMSLEPVFSDCTEIVGASNTLVTCSVTAGTDYFYAVIAGEEMRSTVSGSVDDDGVYTGTSWPPPAGLTTIDSEFRDWVKATRPELENQMWGSPGYLGIKMTRESGELRQQLLDEYVASR
jgi:hypothetical protein